MAAIRSPEEMPALSLRERRLMALFLGEKATREDIDMLTKGLDIDRTSQSELLMLACVGYAQGWELFPPEMVPRLKGLHQYHQVQNTLGVHWLAEKIHILRQAGIPVMLLKGLAMRHYYAVGVPRIMADFDIAVPEEKQEQAMRLLRDGQSTQKSAATSHHDTIIGQHITLEVHRWIFKNHGDAKTDIWDRAVHFSFQGEDVCVPCPLDMFIHQMDNRSRDIFINAFPGRRMNWLCDCRRILDFAGALDVEQVAARAADFHVCCGVRYMLLIFADCFPDILPREEVDRVMPDSPQYRKWLERGRAWQAEEKWYAQFGYGPQNAWTPAHMLRELRRHIARYRFWIAEQPPMEPRYTFWKYVKDVLKIDGPLDFFRKYRRKIRLFDTAEKKGSR